MTIAIIMIMVVAVMMMLMTTMIMMLVGRGDCGGRVDMVVVVEVVVC